MAKKIETIIKEFCYNKLSKSVEDKDIDLFIESIIGYDGLIDDFISAPNVVLGDLFAENKEKYLYIPAYALELRQIIKNNKINSLYKIATFPFDFAANYLNKYDCLIGIDTEKAKNQLLLNIKNFNIYGNSLSLHGLVDKVYSLSRGDDEVSKNIANIIKEENDKISFHVYTQVPGLSTKASVGLMKKYVVNISSLGIDNEVIKSTSPDDAVTEALKRQKKKNQIPHHDPKYTLDFWKRSEFWPFVVNEINKADKIASQQIDTTNFNLSPTEQQIFNKILEVNKKYNLGLTFYAVGGWTRDKLLGKESDDIDIAIDKMTGAEFGKYLAKEMGGKSGNVIKANPDQSKHLETMTINMFGQDVDFVNLRSESYGDSRIPEMQFGTAQDDALRRDLTINSIFYNINSGQIEDFTGHGIEDLKTMTLRTPLDPVKTFKDDPLRILRMLRFYSRYENSKIDNASIEAMKNKEVQEALAKKVSPERIYTEWNKLFSGKKPEEAIRILYETGLWDKVFKPKEMENFNEFTMDQKNPNHTDNVLEHTLKVIKNFNEILRADNAGDEERAKALSAAFFHDIGKLDPAIIGFKKTVDGILHQTYHGHEDVSARLSEIILKALKASNEDIQYISSIVQKHMLPHEHSSEMSDKQMRRLLRELGDNLFRRVIQHAKADATSKPGADGSPYDKLLERLKNIQPSAANKNSPPIDRRKIMSLPEYASLVEPSKIKLGWLNEITTELQDIKDNDPNVTEESLLNYCKQVAPRYNQKYNNPILPVNTKQAQTWYSKMREMGEKEGSVDWLCGDVVKDYLRKESKEKNVFLKTNETFYILEHKDSKNDDVFHNIINKNICAKGSISGYKFIISEWKVNEHIDLPYSVKREQPQDISQFQVGMKVRHRQRGLLFPQITGIIKRIQDNLMYVKWDGVPEQEVFNLDDTVNLYLNLTKL